MDFADAIVRLKSAQHFLAEDCARCARHREGKVDTRFLHVRFLQNSKPHCFATVPLFFVYVVRNNLVQLSPFFISTW